MVFKPSDDDFVDVVATAETDSPPSTAASPPDPGLSAEPESVTKLLREGQSPLLASGSKETEEDKLMLQLAEEKRQEQLKLRVERAYRLKSIRENTKLLEYSGDFLRDMAGFEPFIINSSPAPWIKCTFQVMSADKLEQITTQNIRDMFLGRTRFVSESSLRYKYQFAATLKTCIFSDPQTGEILWVYDVVANLPAVQQHTSLALDKNDGLICRTADYLLNVIFKSSSVYAAVLGSFTEFQSILSDLSYLAKEDPDFFQKCLTAEPPQG